MGIRVQPATFTSACDNQSHYRVPPHSPVSASASSSPLPSLETRESSSNSLALCPFSVDSRTKSVESPAPRHAGRVCPDFAQRSSSSRTRSSALHSSRSSRPSSSSPSTFVDHSRLKTQGVLAAMRHNPPRPSDRNTLRVRSKSDRALSGAGGHLQYTPGLPFDVRLRQRSTSLWPAKSSRRLPSRTSPKVR